MVDESVVVSAEQHQVVQVGPPAVGPGNQVMGVGPARRPITVGIAASVVSHVQGAPECSGGESAGAAGIEDLTAAAEHQRQDLGIARQSADGLDR